MPSLKAIRNRIQSVKNTRKITRALKLVAAAKLKRAQDAIIAARPYSAALGRVVSELSGVAGKEAHPLFEERPAKRAAIVVVTSDRGLAGAFNSNVIKAVERYAQNELADTSEVTLRIVGKKANQHFARRRANIASFDAAPTSATAAQIAHDTANRVIEDFKAGKVDRVFVVYNEFKNAGTNIVRVNQLLPVIPEKPDKSDKSDKSADRVEAGDFVYEPSQQELLTRLVPLYVQNQLYRATLESIAEFFSDRALVMIGVEPGGVIRPSMVA